MMRNDNSSTIRWIPAGLTIAWLLCISSLHAQSKATFESMGPEREVTEGSRFEVSFSLKNANGKRFIAPDFKGFRVTAGPVEMRGAGFINGQSYSHQTWSYELEAGSPGTYTVGPATVQTATQTLRSQPLTIRVVQARQGRTKPAPGVKDNVFVSGELDHTTAWVGQQLRFQIKLYTQLSISNFDILDLPKFDGFYTVDRRRFDTRTQYETIRGKRYAVRILHEIAIFPQESGELLIDAARVRIGVEQAGGLGSLLGATPVLMQTQPVRLDVKPLPDPAPAGFSGAVGHYEWQVTADKTELSTDDALTLTVAIQGNGDARRFANPKFELPEGLEGFDPKAREEEEYETGDQFVHAKTLEYVILPKQPGVYTFSPQLTVFDPDSNTYRTLKSAVPVQINVTAGKNYGQNQALTDTLAAPPPLQSPLISFWKLTGAWLVSPMLWGALGGAAMFAGAFFFWKNRKAKNLAKPVDTPNRTNLKEARERLKQLDRLLANSDSKAFFLELLKAMQAYLSVRLELEPSLLTKEAVQEKLTGLQISDQVTNAFLKVWQTCEQAVFAGQARAGDMHASWQLAEWAVQELESYFKR